MRRLQQFTYDSLLIFGFLGALFIPFSFSFPNPQPRITHFLFGDLILYTASFFSWVHISNPEISSDSVTLYVLMLLLMLLAVILTTAFTFSNFLRRHRSQIVCSLQLALTFYLSIVMLKYGFDKIFKAQFYLPEPNTLFTPLGMLDKDILYWSTMGTSHAYNIFMGLTEVIPAILLLFSRTRVIGLFILVAVLTNVVLVNFGFDISVKLYSSFLLLLCLMLIAPSLKALFQFFVLQKPAVLNAVNGRSLVASRPARLALKTLFMILFFAETVFPYTQKQSFNDDNTPRNYLHGAYQVTKVEYDSTGENAEDLKRLFIHRQNYLIFQYANDSMVDFKLSILRDQDKLTLTNYDGEVIQFQFRYSESTGMLELKSEQAHMTIHATSLPWKELPLLQPLFHWSVDNID